MATEKPLTEARLEQILDERTVECKWEKHENLLEWGLLASAMIGVFSLIIGMTCYSNGDASKGLSLTFVLVGCLLLAFGMGYILGMPTFSDRHKLYVDKHKA